MIPGVDGLNMEAVDQFDILSGSFDVWSMKVRGDDQSTFAKLTEQVQTTAKSLESTLLHSLTWIASPTLRLPVWPHTPSTKKLHETLRHREVFSISAGALYNRKLFLPSAGAGDGVPSNSWRE